SLGYLHLPYLHSSPTRRSSDLGSCYTSKSIPLRLDGGTHSLALLWRALLGALAYVSKKVSAFWYRCLHSVRVGFLLRDFSAASLDRKSTRLNSSHVKISYAVFC